MDNAAEGNLVQAFDRNVRDKLTPAGEFGTGTLGTGAPGGVTDQNSVPSYQLGKEGSLTVISPSDGTTEAVVCRVIVSNEGRFTGTTNGDSGSISGYSIGFDVSLTSLDAGGRTGKTGTDTGPPDMALSNDGRTV